MEQNKPSQEQAQSGDISKDQFTINPDTGRLVSGGEEFLDTPAMRKLITRANKIREDLPPVHEGYVRVWRGNRPDEVGKALTFTSSLEGIALPYSDAYGGGLSFVDVRIEDLSKYEQKKIVAAEGAEFVLPPELAHTARVAKDTLQPVATPADVTYEVSPDSPKGWDAS